MATNESSNSVPVRKVWPTEDRHFTPWLAENIDRLSEAVGINLELVQEETPLPGGGRVDILAKIAGTGEYVVIENQMERSDNDHLAGLLNYASQSGSKVLIWVAGEFTDWHRRTLDWLNELNGMQIYGVKMSAWRKGETIERGLELVAGPNHRLAWPGFTYPAIKLTYLDFFRPVVAALWEKGIADKNLTKAGNNQVFPSGFSGIGYNVGFWHSFGGSPSLDVYLWIATRDQDRNKEIFDALNQYREEIECELPGVSWDRRDHQGMCSIYFIKRGSIKDSDEKLAELREWVLAMLPKLKAAFQPRLEKVMRELTPDEDLKDAGACAKAFEEIP